MRRVALERKNWLRIGSEETGPKVAAILSIMETFQRLKINAREYLEDVLPRIADWKRHITDLTPLAWLPRRTNAAAQNPPKDTGYDITEPDERNGHCARLRRGRESLKEDGLRIGLSCRAAQSRNKRGCAAAYQRAL
jgi:hypothetical protein